MNIPNYLAPAPPFNEIHEFTVFRDFIRYGFVICCTCGWESFKDEVYMAGVPGVVFYDEQEKHLDERERIARLAAKWGGLDNAPTAG